MTAQIIATLLPVFLIAGCGTLYGRFRTPDIRSLNTLNMEIFVPMLVFAVLADRQAPLAEYAGLALGAVVVVLGSGLVLWPLVRLLRLEPKTFLPPMMFNNSGNMGIPLLVLAFGEAALPAAVVVFIVEMLLHFSVGLYMLSPRTPLWRLLRMPIVLASLAGLGVNLGGVPLPGWLLEALHMLGGVCIPLMLFALGVRMLDIDFGDWRTGLLGAVLCPLSGLVLAAPMILWLELTGLQAAALWVFAALPPAVLNYLVAEQYRQEPHKVASLVLIGNLGSLVVMPLVLALVFMYVHPGVV
ncbi:AEC family transporter [Halomonas sp. MCCC 1A17488]|uniref:AEC family transporter n=1 Tax=Billgrantia sulfidoxydans TaxID=2733484 RepID=A0ABX7W8K4_9GAMM|nr:MULTISPECIES: AEC family transporter [Halomonas]MCE8018314.1 AEC family transporter [Halomonas sp. MCCC 1A17488]MCG3241647.1 AEC family transporter [Halomonas sp. MCCC 1A17488]QPP49321.1 AEC family transporter [Halomonas sp. SS10-MC5]QTP56678.1 AEC family transporter [Halomonas sulfidoxydans]